MRGWKFWDWVGYGCLGASALVEALNTALKSAPELAEKLPSFFSLPIWGFLPASLFSIASIVLLVRAFRKPKDVATVAPRPEISSDPAIDWALWKRRKSYTMRELPRMLAKEDPVADKLSARAQTIQRLLFEAMKDGSLDYIKVPSDNLHYDYELPDFDTRVPRQAALIWARLNGIDVSHVGD